jgi:drug/metabolite transporter (DMT)-like permease
MRRRGILLMIVCTLFTASGQLFYKLAAPTLSVSFSGIFLNIQLLIGLFLYFCGAVMLLLALKQGELSAVYPIISLTFVWVLIIGALFFNEAITGLKLAGTLCIIIGVAMLS